MLQTTISELVELTIKHGFSDIQASLSSISWSLQMLRYPREEDENWWRNKEFKALSYEICKLSTQLSAIDAHLRLIGRIDQLFTERENPDK